MLLFIVSTRSATNAAMIGRLMLVTRSVRQLGVLYARLYERALRTASPVFALATARREASSNRGQRAFENYVETKRMLELAL